MDSSTSPDTATQPAPREVRLDTVAAQAAAIDALIGLAQQKLRVVALDRAEPGGNTAARAESLAAFLRRAPKAKFELIGHDTRWMEASCPRLLNLLKLYSTAMTVYRTGPEARMAMDPLIIVDGRHYLHRFHIDQ